MVASSPHCANPTIRNTTTHIDLYVFNEEVQFSILGVLVVAIVVGNASVIVALLFTKTRKSRMNFFIMQLAIADLLVGLTTVVPDIIQKLIITWYAGNIFCKIYKFLQVKKLVKFELFKMVRSFLHYCFPHNDTVMFASTYVLVALSVDRCDAILRPMKFSGSWKRARVLVASAWGVSMLCNIPNLILFKEVCVEGRLQCYTYLSTAGWQLWVTTQSVLVLVLPTLIIAACYSIIMLTIWKKSRDVVLIPSVNNSKKAKSLKNGGAEKEPESGRASSRGIIPKAKIKSVKMSFVIVLVFILCWAPFFVFALLQVYAMEQSQWVVSLGTIIMSLAPLNSAANPLICCIFSPHIYNSLSRIPPYSWCWRVCGGSSGGTARSNIITSTQTRTTQKSASSLNMVRRGSSATVSSGERSTRLPLASAPRD